MSKLWGGRFQGQLDPEFAEFNRSLGFDIRLLAEDIGGSAAWAVALGEAGVLTDDEVGTIHDGLEHVLENAKPALIGAEDEDVHSFVERLLTDRIGDLAKKLHTGRSRNDQVGTDLRLYLRGACIGLFDGLTTLLHGLVTLADETADLAMPGYTHLQRAQPITAGHWALAYAEMFARDRERILQALTLFDSCPLGCGALAGTAFPIDREELATDLGFQNGPMRNSLDAVGSRDHVCDVVFACTQVMVNLSRMAEDTIFFCSQEAGYARFGDLVSTGSSLMPQKRNPDAMELLRGKTGRVIGSLSALLVTTKGLPLAYNKDLQEDKEALFDAIDTTDTSLRVATIALSDLTFDRDRCAAAASTGYLDATDLADLLVHAGVPFRDAHDRVGAAVNRAVELGVELRDLGDADRQELLPEIDGDLGELLSVDAVLARRSCLGGTAPDQVRERVEEWRDALTAEQEESDDEGTEP